uniref:Uncharacterized protein n=1 Tax=Oryza sativa subsp. japonica TaxID=39947 RepID=Q69V43_ORYSJ|nr:hypothetical protein [Oryza sativa Japonica Group]BAD35635.1 hypothetical protein [Oryza sativa Japonica Group]
MAGEAEDGDGERLRLFVSQVPPEVQMTTWIALPPPRSLEAATASCTATDSAVPSGGRRLGPAGPDAATAVNLRDLR